MNRWEKQDLSCKKCNVKTNLTRHHLKNKWGGKTGEMEILCRACHDMEEKRYIQLGIITKNRGAGIQ
jgi:hypothetical protein